jgi:hypothetical protein
MITQEYLKDVFDYNPETGTLVRKKFFSNRSKLGVPLGSPKNGRHMVVSINRKYYGIHRIVWMYVYGKWPDGVIDHINGDPTDNRICNLRDCKQSHNLCNSKLPTTNKTGVKGVSWDAERNKWFAKINYKKKQYALGRYDDFGVACEVVNKKRIELHGDYARFI